MRGPRHGGRQQTRHRRGDFMSSEVNEQATFAVNARLSWRQSAHHQRAARHRCGNNHQAQATWAFSSRWRASSSRAAAAGGLNNIIHQP